MSVWNQNLVNPFFFRPPFIFGYDPSFTVDSEYYIASIVVFAGSLLQANVYIILRMLKNIHFSVTLLVFGVVGTIESSGLSLY